RLFPGVSQPVVAGDYVATLWQGVTETAEPRAEHLGELLAQLHAKPPPDILPRWDPVADVRRKIADAGELAADDRTVLPRQCESLRRRLTEQRFHRPWSVVHGDAHLGNVIVGPDGPVLCDLDSTCVGPPEWDLAPLAVGRLRMGH